MTARQTQIEDRCNFMPSQMQQHTYIHSSLASNLSCSSVDHTLEKEPSQHDELLGRPHFGKGEKFENRRVRGSALEDWCLL